MCLSSICIYIWGHRISGGDFSHSPPSCYSSCTLYMICCSGRSPTSKLDGVVQGEMGNAGTLMCMDPISIVSLTLGSMEGPCAYYLSFCLAVIETQMFLVNIGPSLLD